MVIRKFGIAALLSLATLASASESGILSYRAQRSFDNGKLTADLCRIAGELVQSDPEIGAILLECSDLPPYARAIQAVTGLPVFDFNTMIDLVYHSVVQKTYYGYF